MRHRLTENRSCDFVSEPLHVFGNAFESVAWSFLPFLWLIIMSVTPSAALVHSPPSLLPNGATLENYGFVLFPSHASGGASSVQATRVPYGI